MNENMKHLLCKYKKHKGFFITNYKKHLHICLNEVHLMLDCVLRRFLIRDIYQVIFRAMFHTERFLIILLISLCTYIKTSCTFKGNITRSRSTCILMY